MGDVITLRPRHGAHPPVVDDLFDQTRSDLCQPGRPGVDHARCRHASNLARRGDCRCACHQTSAATSYDDGGAR